METNIQITGRHIEVSDTLRSHIEGKLGAVLSEHPSVEHVHVILDVQKFRQIVEIVIQAKHHVKVEATDESDDMYVSVDKVIDKVDRQLRRSRDKVVDHKGSGHRTKLSDFEPKVGL